MASVASSTPLPEDKNMGTVLLVVTSILIFFTTKSWLGSAKIRQEGPRSSYVTAADRVLISILRVERSQQIDERLNDEDAEENTGQTEPYLFQDQITKSQILVRHVSLI